MDETQNGKDVLENGLKSEGNESVITEWKLLAEDESDDDLTVVTPFFFGFVFLF